MSKSITLMGATYPDVPAVLLPSGSGTAKFVDVDDWSWIGKEVTSLGKLYEAEFALSETSFPSWTASTTAAAILATANVATISADMENYEYILHWTCRFDAKYNSGATLKAIPFRECQDAWQAILRRPNSVGTVESKNYAANGCVTIMTAPLHVYYNTSGNKAYTYSNSYGFYQAVQAATFSNATTLTPTITVKRPTLNVRCYSSQFATGRKGDIDTSSEFKLYGEGFRVPVGTIANNLYHNVIDLYNAT